MKRISGIISTTTVEPVVKPKEPKKFWAGVFLSLVLLGVVLTQGCSGLALLSPLLEGVSALETAPSTSSKITGLMLTPVFVMQDLPGVYGKDLTKLRKAGWTHLYGVLDLDVPPGPRARPYIGPGRTRTKVTDLAVKNMMYCRSKGFKLMVVLGNEPTVRLGQSYYMSHKKNIDINWLYGPVQLEEEKSCLTDLYRRVNPDIIVLYLEPSRTSSRAFCVSLAAHLRTIGYTGRIYSSGIGSGYLSASGDIGSMTSLNDLGAWRGSGEQLKCSDGFFSFGPNQFPEMLKSPGPHGVVFWFPSLAYSQAVPGKVEPYMLDLK